MSETKIIRAHHGFQELFVRTNVDVAFGGGVLAAGKAQPLYADICTPFGFRKLGDLKVGDKISSTTGGYETVIQIFERGVLDNFEFTFEDGRKIECAKDHLWKARRVGKRPKWYDKSMDREDLWEIMTTEKVISILDSKYNNKVFVPLCEPVQFTKGCRNQGLTIHPYLLGCLLGDGCFSERLYTPMLTTIDHEIVEKISSLGYNIHNIPSSEKTYYIYDKNVVTSLKQKHLWGKHSYDKFIPECYKTSYIEDRYELIQGLFDTDGTVDEKGNIEYFTTSKQLCDDVVWIIRSLGGWASVHVKKGRYTKDGETIECRDCFRVSVNIRNAEKLFHLTRKKERIKTEKYRGGGTDEELGVISYRKLPPTEMRCITVSNPNRLYITNDFTVTHNTFGAALATAEPSLDPDWRGLVVKNNIDDLKRGGGVIDTFSKELYGTGAVLRMSEMPRLTFPSGAWVDFAHLADQSVDAIQRRFKSSQYDWIYFDELTGFTWDAFKTLLTRNRGKSAYAGKCLATTNPERESWIRDFIDWYIDDEGFIMSERSGIVRYFYMMGSDVKDVVWGNTKEEVYRQCKSDIDKKLDKVYGFMNGRDKWKTMIKSFTFYLGRISENKEMLENNEGYVGSIAMTGGAEAAKLLEGNWNVSSRDDEDNLLTFDEANSVFTNEPQRNGDKWITADLADFGTDNFLQLAWDGLHIIDIDIAPHTTPKENADRMKMFANKHNVAYKHIIFDGVRGRYINDYIPEAIPFESYRAPFGVNALQYVKLKDCCYGKLIWLIKNNLISCTEEVARRIYTHQLLKSDIRIQDEFVAEARVVRFIDGLSGKKRLMTKKEMNKKLGRGRSMDLLDPTAMRMYPLLDIADGYELESSRRDYEREQEALSSGEKVDIYDETNWY
jgi:hypothetical protein